MAKSPLVRPPKEIIDDALGDNRSWEWLCYGLVLILVAAGLTAFFAGIIQGRDVVTVTGGGVAALLWPLLHFARGISTTAQC